MTTAAVLLAAGGGSRFDGPDHKLRSELGGRPLLSWSVGAAIDAGLDEVVVVVGADRFEDLLGQGVSVVDSPRWAEGQALSLQAAIGHARAAGHDAVVVGVADQPFVGASCWSRVAAETSAPIVAARFGRARRPPVRLAADIWDELPASGDEGARVLMQTHPELVISVACGGDPLDVDTEEALAEAGQRLADRETVTRLLGRPPRGRFEVVVRDDDGVPVVLRNEPLLDDGTPMPTLYWLCGEREQMLVGRLESLKGVKRAEREVGLEAIAEAHARYRAERDALLDATAVDPERRPTGGVGGTRTGVKCLHAHYAWWLAGGDDPVGRWVADHLVEVDRPDWPAIATAAEET